MGPVMTNAAAADTTRRPLAVCLCVWLLASAVCVSWTSPTWAVEDVAVEVEDKDESSLITSAIQAFDRYLESVDAGNLEEAEVQVLDPGTADGRRGVVENLLSFIRARLASQIENEGVVVRIRGDWALVVYQYDMTRDGQTTRIITTAWMIKNQGFWRQFVVAPVDRGFWNKNRRADFDALQAWFDRHAREIAGRNDGDGTIVVPVSMAMPLR